MMEWDNQQKSNNHHSNLQGIDVNGGGMYVKVMTDEQLETLRKQIAIYATICERLVEMHKTITSQQDLSGGRMGGLSYAETSIGPKMTGRQRRTPTPVQLRILERLFDQGIGTPSRQKIKDITNTVRFLNKTSTIGSRTGVLGLRESSMVETETETETLSEKRKFIHQSWLDGNQWTVYSPSRKDRTRHSKPKRIKSLVEVGLGKKVTNTF